MTVARAVMELLPGEEILYLGDTAHTPFGPRHLAEVRDLTIAGLDVLVGLGAKMLVIACNTATVAAVDEARQRHWAEQGIPVVEVISPTTRDALARTRTGRVGVLATIGTVKSRVYPRALMADPTVRVVSQACPRFVEFVEKGITSGEELERVATGYLQPVKDQDVDTVILGCTHYPYLSETISKILGPGVQLVSSSEGTAKVVAETLTKLNLQRDAATVGPADPPRIRLYATGDSPQFLELARRFLGGTVDTVEIIQTD